MYKKEGKPFSICFVPYKEEMWDSMESVYVEARKDPECRAKVVPLPYYKIKNFEPTTLTTEFEGYGFGSIEKDFDHKHYDVIVFHYPYDDMNILTRPVINTSTLKYFCDNLVYIPYYVPCNVPTENMIITKGAINADLIIVDSFETKKEYMKYFTDKVVDWGSPKFDRLNNSNYPKWWDKYLSGKKVVLINNSLVSFTNNPQKVIDELKGLIEEVINGEIGAIWRPHPLFKQLLMQKQYEPYKGAYEGLENMAYKCPNIVIDKSDDMYMAMNYSDELWSNPSSLIPIYKQTGKPIRIWG